MPKIISRNYRDRSSEYKWLVRDAEQTPEEAVACKRVVATDIQFQLSTAYEDGFGCSIVARAEDAELFDIEPPAPPKPTPPAGMVPLIFTGIEFVAAGEADAVKRLAALQLEADGSMFAALPDPEPEPAVA